MEYSKSTPTYLMSDVMTNVTDTSRIGSNPNNGRPKSSFLPREEWNKLTQDQEDTLIVKRHQESANDNSSNKGFFQPQRQANLHDVGNVVDFGDIVDYAVMSHDIDPTENEPSSKESAINDDNVMVTTSQVTSVMLPSVHP
jgi:hypothetical protein